MARLKDLAFKTNDAFLFDPENLYIEPGWNARHHTPLYEAGILELMASIRVNGVKNPIVVSYENGRAKVTEGHRRHEAVRRLHLEGRTDIKLRAVPELVKTEEDERVASMVTRNTGVPLTPQETADVCKRLRTEHKWEVSKIALTINVSTTYVDGLLLLADSPQEIVDMMDRGEVAATTVIKILREKGHQAAIELLRDATAMAALDGKEKATPKHVAKVKQARAAEAAAVLAQDLEPEEADGHDEPAPEPQAPGQSPASNQVPAEAPGKPQEPSKVPAQASAPRATEEGQAAPAKPAQAPGQSPASAQVPQAPALAPGKPQEPSQVPAQASAPRAPEEAPAAPAKPAKAPAPLPLDYKVVALKLKSHMEEIFNAEGEAAVAKAIHKAAAYYEKTFVPKG